MWWLGFVFHEMSFGLLSVFIPLYIVAISGSLIHVGIISLTALVVAIPASFLWGHLCDRSRHYKPYILLSFLLLAFILYATAFTTDISLLIALYALMAFFHMAHEAPKNVFIAETYMRRGWERAYALYGGVTRVGWLIGIFVGLFMSASGLRASSILLACSGLNLMAFIISIFFLSDPIFASERNLVRIERGVLRIYRGVTALRPAGDICAGVDRGLPGFGEARTGTLCFGLIAFFMATGALFTPLPVFFSRSLALPQSMIYALFCANSLGGIIGYALIIWLDLYSEGRTLYRMAALRGALALLLIAIGFLPGHGAAFAAAILFLSGLAYAVFHVLSFSMFMEVLPERMAGLLNVVTGLGEALGSFIGPFIAERFGFTHLFLIAGLTFLISYVILKLGGRPPVWAGI